MRKKDDILKIIVFVDRMELSATIDSIHKNEINPTDLEKETVEYIMDNIDSLEIDNLEELDDEAQKAAAISKFLKNGIIWGRNNNTQLVVLEFNTNAIRKEKGE